MIDEFRRVYAEACRPSSLSADEPSRDLGSALPPPLGGYTFNKIER